MVQISTDANNTTPPSHPIYGVSLERHQIAEIVSCSFPGVVLTQCAQLPRGGSFNNRIYFLEVQVHSGDPQSPIVDNEAWVLKVNGRFFGRDKIQNEVGCLWLLEAHCPDVPAPRVKAWSENGLDVTSLPGNRTQARKVALKSHSERVDGDENSGPGWILMTKVEGKTLSSLTLDSAQWEQVAMQVAKITACWRQGIPSQPHCGNIAFVGEPVDSLSIIQGPDHGPSTLSIHGVVGDGITFSDPVTTTIDLYRIKISDKLHKLETVDVYAPNRDLCARVKDFVATTLDNLDGLNTSRGAGCGVFVFTHYDLSPRNILVSHRESTLAVSGIVDFEFAGFFPAFEEFVNAYVDNGGDWPEAAYKAYLQRLEDLGESTPARGFKVEVWKQAALLGQLLENIAPWWLPGDHGKEDLATELHNAKEKAIDAISGLNEGIGRIRTEPR
ncbi:hypothetical protein BX600DRAFT_467939 [Xylariales sp. PMI_506]|nr:hypothetical protein BX600DRAFT_467939 [Xylariales sp. PMI_506]